MPHHPKHHSPRKRQIHQAQARPLLPRTPQELERGLAPSLEQRLAQTWGRSHSPLEQLWPIRRHPCRKPRDPTPHQTYKAKQRSLPCRCQRLHRPQPQRCQTQARVLCRHQARHPFNPRQQPQRLCRHKLRSQSITPCRNPYRKRKTFHRLL